MNDTLNKDSIVVISQSSSQYSLTSSYVRALKQLGYDVTHLTLSHYLSKRIKLGWIGKKIYQFIKVRTWERQANRDLAVKLKELSPDILIITGKSQVLPGTIAFLKSFLPVRVICIWMDTLCNLDNETVSLAPLTDLLATYSSSSISVFEKLGFTNTKWIALGGDHEIHLIEDTPQKHKYDVSFIGGWRPEREKVILTIIRNFPELNIRIFGYYWDRAKEAQILKPYIENKTVTGEEYAALINGSRINLNVIDDTNYPSANMRFFEIPMANGLQLCSACPEQEEIFKDGRDIFYFKNEEQLIAKIRTILDSPRLASEVRKNGNSKVLGGETYIHRSQKLLGYIKK